MSKPSEKEPSPLIAEFEQDCIDAKTTAPAVLKLAGVHTSLWWKWKKGDVSPTLRTFEAARQALDQIAQGRAA